VIIANAYCLEFMIYVFHLNGYDKFEFRTVNVSFCENHNMNMNIYKSIIATSTLLNWFRLIRIDKNFLLLSIKLYSAF
jgi:hypothetical protein